MQAACFCSLLFSSQHVSPKVCCAVLQILQEFAIWSETEWGAWNPCEMTFKDTAIGYFNLVQSRMELEPSSIWDKFSHCLPPQEGSQADAHPASHHHLRRKTGTRKAHTVADRASTATG